MIFFFFICDCFHLHSVPIKLKIFNDLHWSCFNICPRCSKPLHSTIRKLEGHKSAESSVFTAPEKRKNAKHSANRNNLRATGHLRELPCVLNCSQLWLDPLSLSHSLSLSLSLTQTRFRTTLEFPNSRSSSLSSTADLIRARFNRPD